ncbi:ribonucleases P/MRP protein subunit POP1-like [Atheta coriaria]|uniref:ribonucleases P/MRP protein subunit POP1-like n=1 Tax=Dalotia coriaria TaxID=877792 RepID=UPI0031F3D427
MNKNSIPESVPALFFASARIREIKTVTNLLQAQNGTKLAFQKLPRHMRRRVMGHSTKRVPQSIKQIHQNQLEKSGLPPKSKRPSRKFRRRPKLLNAEITRRQRENKWLETHIWHAKRFHMINKWSYKIPYSPTDKAFRACYRATMKHCLLQDISYTGCIELKGKQDLLIETFKKLTRSDEGLSIHAKAYIDGNREGKTMFYDYAENVPIGSVMFNWQPVTASKQRTIWLWVHAAYYQQVLDSLITHFDLPADKSQKQWINKKVQITDLRFELNRFRLTGPLSQAILTSALKPVDACLEINSWLQEYLEDDEQRQLFSEQIEYWNSVKQVQTPAMLSPHITFSLVITDPRYSMPNQRTKALNSTGEMRNVDPPNGLSNGAIWNQDIRQNVTESKLSNVAINELRSQLLVPGSEMKSQGAQIPLMLIQRPGVSKTGFCSGWDVIIPKGWAQCTWMCFIMWGARAGGYRETENINFELLQQDLFPPDTKAGENENEQLDDANRTRFFRLPPNKRTNFNKFASFSPINCNWRVLLHDWTTTEYENFFVLRSKKVLADLQLYLNNRKHKWIQPQYENYLVPIKITLKKGLVTRYTMICLPASPTDITTPPLETQRRDVHKEERATLRKEHQTLLQRLKKKRHIERTKLHSVSIDKSISQNFMKKMRDLWLPPIGTSGLRTSCSREIMGFVTKGGVSLSNGQGQGIGYVPLPALLHLCSTTKGNQVLCRNTNTRQYRCATLEVLQ